jgi:hypothetical protein
MKNNFFSFAEKRRLVLDIVSGESLLEEKDRKELDGKLYGVMEYRNAFAHGGSEFHISKGCVLR